jgi:23S rRNA (adenine2503-C2)-methyltransferase
MSDNKQPIHLLGMSLKELQSLSESKGQPTFRGKQIADWVYKRNAAAIDDMATLPAAFRSQLAQEAVLYRAKVLAKSRSADGTAKYLLGLEDGQSVEAVLLPYEARVSACVSSQVGCSAGCRFCATGIDGLARNLTAGEMVDQALTLQRESGHRVSHVVYMGMGEPLLNYGNVLRSIYILNAEVGIAMRHFTISTVGITPRIEKLASEKLQLTLAVSLHAPNDTLRKSIIPLADRYPIKGVMAACRRYAGATHRRVTFEYMLIRDLNDSPSMAQELAELLRGMLCNVNLIPYNAVDGLGFARSPQGRVKTFRAVLEEAGIVVSQRVERGHAVSAACGQLRRRVGD